MARAGWVLYAYKPNRNLLQQLIHWCGWMASNWETTVKEDISLRVNSADFMELLCNLYKVTGKKVLMTLCDQLRQASMDWASVLHTWAVHKPMTKMMEHEELLAGMREESGHEAGYYTRLYYTCHTESLADGARASLMNAAFSGNGREASALKEGWQKLARSHGAVGGAFTADEMLAGRNPSAGVDAAALGAWAETLSTQVTRADAQWACDALEVLVENGLSAAVTEEGIVPFQRANCL